jgi:DnaJ-class molecular chaperone
LFADLPVQKPSPFRETDEHWLEPCSHCRGSGRAEPERRGSVWHLIWPPVCRHCNGAGKRLIHAGKAADV